MDIEQIRKDIFEEIDNSELEKHSDCKFLMEILDKETFRNLLLCAGGLRFSLPSLKSFTNSIEGYIRKYYSQMDIYHIKKISSALQMNEQTVRTIYNKVRAEKIACRQEELFKGL